ncbi:hemagglutinin repeat-containing protein [Acetobacter cibinongensis]|uniref:Uncharacterized protein n=1 Tax=Acetobacter cibinongensis TaxID=146475 RepID=A0A1Z5YRI8_9PROT|nr:hemagglutinin repeat-containing protein [Acetobacter cibinongensis]OUI99282.1 hypothetical protein HK14_14465 [Acetobacter cibinongensis]
MSASKDISLDAGWNKTNSQSTSSSKSFSVGANANVGTSGAGVSISASGSMSHTHTEAESATAVDTTVTATEGITIVAPGTTTLNGAEVSGKNIVLNTGNLLITSPVNTASYEKEAYGGSVGVTIPVWGAAMGGASVSLNYEKITDRYASTGERLSGVYAGSGGLDVVVQGDTVLKAGVLDSEAPSSLNRFSTGTQSDFFQPCQLLQPYPAKTTV